MQIKKTNIVLSKAKRLKLYEEVFDRDKCCQLCGYANREYFAPHHIIPVSRGRIDAAWNLLTLCNKPDSPCHMKLHNGELSVSVNDLINKYIIEEDV